MKEKLFASIGESTVGTVNEPGTGLGLIICRDFVNRNHGEIRLDKSDSTGTTISIILPTKKEPN